MEKIRLLKDWKDKKVGDIINISKIGAEQFIKENAGEYVTEENHIVKSSVTSNTVVTSNTDTSVTTVLPVLSVTATFDMANLLFPEDSITNRIIKLFITSDRYFTYDEIAKVVSKKEENIRQAMSRKRELFSFFKLDGRKNLSQMSQIGLKEVKQRIEIYTENIKKKAEFEEKQKNKKGDSDSLLLEAKSFLETVKKEVGNDIKQGKKSVEISFQTLSEFSPILADSLVEKPEETIKVLEAAFENLFLTKNVYIRIKHLPSIFKRNIEQLRSRDLDHFIALTGRVITLSDVRPQVVEAKFECPSCGTIMTVLQIDKRFREPPRCSCGRRGGFRLLSKEMVDTARLILEDLQEKTDNPHSKRISCFIKDDLLSENNMRLYLPGNEIEVVGVMKEVPVPLKTGGSSTRFEIAFEVNSVDQANEEITYEKLSEEDIKEIREFSQRLNQNGFDEILESFCPEVYGYDYIKKAIILQLAAKKNKVGKLKEKNKPNILLIGEPGVAKTVLGEFAVDITNGARKSVGGSASAVGFTGAVVRDEYSGGWSLEPGAIVLAKDFFLLDELNNIKEEDRPRLQEALSENTITIDKATIHTRLPSPAAVLATANPIEGIFNEGEDLTKQFSLTAPIINRFDLIFAVKDSVDKEMDQKIAKKMNDRERKKINCKYDRTFLRKFFIYIKEQENPRIEEEISNEISNIYAKLRTYKTKSLNINPRVHLAFLQLCKASAKLRLSDKIEEKDIEIALDVLSKSYFKTPSYLKLRADL